MDGEEWRPPPAAHGPFHSPIDRYAMLPEKTRKMLEHIPEDVAEHVAQLRIQDIKDLEEFIRFGRSVRTLSRFGRSAVIFLIGGFTAVIVFGEKVAIAWKWITGAAR